MDSRAQLGLSLEILNFSEQEVLELLAEYANKPFDPYSFIDGDPLFSAYQRLAELNPELATEKVLALDFMKQQTFGYIIFFEWAKKDAASAWATSVDLKNSMLREIAQSSVLTVMAESDIDQAYQFAIDNGAEDLVWSVLQKMAQKSPLKAMEKAEEVKDGSNHWQKQFILTSWASTDPDGAVDYAVNLASKGKQKEALTSVIRVIGVTNIDKALSILSANEDRFNGQDFSLMFQHIGEQEPQATMDWVKANIEVSKQDEAVSGIVSSWIESDDEAAKQWLSSFPEGDEKEALFQEVLPNIVYSNPKMFLDLYDQLENKGSIDDWSFANAIGNLTEENPDEAWSYLQNIEKTTVKKKAMTAFMKNFSQSEPDKALAMAESITDEQQKNIAMGGVMQGMSSSDPERVAQMILDNPQSKYGDFSINNFVSNWATGDLDEAKSFVTQLDDPIIRDKAVTSLINQWGVQDPVQAVEYLFTLEKSAALDTSLWSLGRNLAAKNPKEGLQLILNNESQRNLEDSFFESWANEDPEAFIENIKDLPEEYHKDSYYGEVSRSLAQSDPQKGIQLIASLEEGSKKNTSARVLASSWANEDLESASRWVNKLPSGDSRDSAIQGIISHVKSSEPQYALEWADVISNPKKRINNINQNYRQWKRVNPDAALQWLNTTQSLTVEEKKKLQ